MTLRCCVTELLCWCVDVLMCRCVDDIALMCWYVDMLMCCCVAVLMCWWGGVGVWSQNMTRGKCAEEAQLFCHYDKVWQRTIHLLRMMTKVEGLDLCRKKKGLVIWHGLCRLPQSCWWLCWWLSWWLCWWLYCVDVMCSSVDVMILMLMRCWCDGVLMC